MWEWNETAWSETALFSSSRGLRGGSFDLNLSALPAPARGLSDPAFQESTVGFRVASIPEPSSLLLGALGMVGLLLRRRKG